MNDSSIVDEDIQTAEQAVRFGNHVFGIAPFADIGPDKFAGGAECACGRFPRLTIDIGDDNLGPLGRITVGDGKPDSLCAPGDDCDLVFELHDELRFTPAKLSCGRMKAKPSPMGEGIGTCGSLYLAALVGAGEGEGAHPRVATRGESPSPRPASRERKKISRAAQP